MLQLLLENQLLLLFLVSAIGFAVGRITIAGTSLGVAAVLFVGLAFGALHPDLKLPEVVYQLGLVLFVYTVGLASGRQFFDSLGRKGLRDNLLVVGLLVAAAGLTLLAGRVLSFSGALAAGVFAGSLTNTPALAAVLESVAQSAPPDVREQLLAEPVVGYSLTYPLGVLAPIASIVILRRIWRVDAAGEAAALESLGISKRPLQNLTIRVTRPEVRGTPLRTIIAACRSNVTIGRIRHNGTVTLADAHTTVEPGDLVSVIGAEQDVARMTAALGDATTEHLEADRHAFDFRRVFVSRPELAGRRLQEFNLPERFGAFVTRIRRGDEELVAHGSSRLQLGDRVRVVARAGQMQAVSSFFGDSYRALSEIDMLTFTLGLALGLVVGMVPLPLPGGVSIRLGIAGGPLVVALILGSVQRTGPLVWTLPYSANLTLRQFGLILFLAGVGTRSGYAFVATLRDGGGLPIVLAGGLISIAVSVGLLWISYRLLRMPSSVAIGMLAGLQTQPAVLGFALEQADNEAPNIGYAAVYPVALIAKIVLAQLVLLAFSA